MDTVFIVIALPVAAISFVLMLSGIMWWLASHFSYESAGKVLFGLGVMVWGFSAIIISLAFLPTSSGFTALTGGALAVMLPILFNAYFEPHRRF